MFSIASALQNWWHARITPRDLHTLTQRTVYILPTAPGWMMALTLLVLLVASINFQLNLGYLLTFILGGAIVVGVYIGQASLTGMTLQIDVQHALVAVGFAGSNTDIPIQLVKKNGSGSPSLGFRFLAREGLQGTWLFTHLPSKQTAPYRVTLPHVFAKRGLQDLPLVHVQTLYPLGIFRIWTIWRIQSQALIYPMAEPNPPPWQPKLASKLDATSDIQPAPQPDDCSDVRAFRSGDSPRQLLWKSVAKRPDTASAWSVKTPPPNDAAAPAPPPTLHFDWLDARTSDKELALSRLTAWVLQAQQQGNPYGLRLPHALIEPGVGTPHDAACLKALALA